MCPQSRSDDAAVDDSSWRVPSPASSGRIRARTSISAVSASLMYKRSSRMNLCACPTSVTCIESLPNRRTWVSLLLTRISMNSLCAVCRRDCLSGAISTPVRGSTHDSFASQQGCCCVKCMLRRSARLHQSLSSLAGPSAKARDHPSGVPSCASEMLTHEHTQARVVAYSVCFMHLIVLLRHVAWLFVW